VRPDRRLVRFLGLLAAGCLVFSFAVVPARAQEAPANPAELDTTAVAGEADAQPPATKARGLAKYNQFDLGFTTLRIGYGFLIDLATYSQDAEAKQQVKAESEVDLRDFRLLFKGKPIEGVLVQAALERIDGVVEDGRAARHAAVQRQPAQQLHFAAQVDVAADVEPPANPRLVSAAA